MKLTEKKRESIIEAAIEEFRIHGFLGAKTTRIAKRASVSSRTLYNHFESKEALFQAISKIMVERNTAMRPVTYQLDRPLKEQLVETLERYVEIITEEKAIGLNRMVISELLRDMERSKAFFAEMTTHDYPVTQLIKDAMAAGALRSADPGFAANQLLGLVKTFFFWPEFLLGEKMPMEGVMQDCVSMFLTYYTPQQTQNG